MVVCGLYGQLEDDGSCWLTLYLPLGALEEAYPINPAVSVEDPGFAEAPYYREAIDGWLAEVGTQVFAEANFRIALIGFEVMMSVYAAELISGQPPPPGHGYLLPTAGGIHYLPADT